MRRGGNFLPASGQLAALLSKTGPFFVSPMFIPPSPSGIPNTIEIIPELIYSPALVTGLELKDSLSDNTTNPNNSMMADMVAIKHIGAVCMVI